jgi:rifampicin phosphotransferase
METRPTTARARTLSGRARSDALQARQNTALPDEVIEPVPIPIVVPEGFWQREADHAPRPVSPMDRSFFYEAATAACKQWMDEFGLLMEKIAFGEIGGWHYIRVVPLGGKDRPPPPSWLMPLLVRVVPRIRSRLKVCVQAVRDGKAGQLVQRWYDEWLPMLETRIRELSDVDLIGLSDEALRDHLLTLRELFDECVEIHALLHGAEMVVIADHAFTCRDLLGWDENKAFELLSGLSYKSTEPSRRLTALAQMARERPAVRQVLEEIDESTAGRLPEIDAEFAEAFASYQRQFACRALGYGVSDVTLAEVPSLTLGLIRDQMVRDHDPVEESAELEQKRARVEAEARAALAESPVADRERFERVLASAKRAYPVREDNEFFTISAPHALLRYVLLEMGRRLTERGQIRHRDDVFFLEFDEALAAFRNGNALHELVRRRKGERIWSLANPGPASYGEDPGPPPSFSGLPPEARFAHEALMWVIDRMGMEVPEETLRANARRGAVVRGIAASGGQYTGTVRVVMDESEFHKLQAGDVLVCPVTSPVWSVLFPSIGALVTDTGGILSHPAIIAREYRVPAVVATGNATSLLVDGLMVTVDGSSGLVEIRS